MKKGFLTTIFVLTLVMCFVSVGQAQYFKFTDVYNSETLDDDYNSPKDAVEDAIGAALKFFGSVVGGGMYHTAEMHKVGGVDVGLRGVVASVPSDFDDLPIFVDTDNVGLAFLHGSIGLPANLELIGRFFYFPMGVDAQFSDFNEFSDQLPPENALDSRGGVTLIGGGLKYGLLQKPLLPKIMVMGTYHALFVPDEFDFGTVGTLSFKAVASYSIPLFTVFAGE